MVAASQLTRPVSSVTASPVNTLSSIDSATLRSVRTGAGHLPQFASSHNDDNFTGLSGAKTVPPDTTQDFDHILVVDDSDIALKFMRNRLTRFGFHADLVSSGEEALGRMNTRPYKFVFLDVMMEGLDGYQTCRAIKQRKYSDGKPPVVVILTSRGGTIDKIRGTLAGCDAYLTKPLNERDLIAVLAKHDRNVARGFQQTYFGNNNSGFARSAK
jgi:two-component system, cell cycle response regulator